MEKYSIRQKLTATALVLLGGLTLAGCSDDRDYEGTGDTYIVRGQVHDIERDGTIHINEKQLRVVQAVGKATKWFSDKKGQDLFSDEFNFDPDYNKEGDIACEHEVTVGSAYDENGNEIALDGLQNELQPGTMVEIQGAIVEESQWKLVGKTWICGTDDKNVFTTVRVVTE